MTVDARGYSCPMPVVMVQKTVKADAPAALEVLVDNQCSVENVTRFAESSGYKVAVAPEGQDFRLSLSK
jgi:tRNA 2-thiouridine synthesizing protein A